MIFFNSVEIIEFIFSIGLVRMSITSIELKIKLKQSVGDVGGRWGGWNS